MLYYHLPFITFQVKARSLTTIIKKEIKCNVLWCVEFNIHCIIKSIKQIAGKLKLLNNSIYIMLSINLKFGN